MTQLAVGLMSGTSADSVDAALVKICGERDIELIAYKPRPYSHVERNRIRGIIADGGAPEFASLNFELGRWFAEAVDALLQETGTPAADLSFIASHGHTIWHDPGKTTLQLGEPAVLSEKFGVPVVSNFRVRDVAAGGHGAPLVPRVDAVLFAGPDDRVLLNIGGIANVTWVPASGERSEVIAYDTGPGMTLIDTIVRDQCRGEGFDVGGARAAAGKSDPAVVTTLLRDKYFQLPPPKSTGRELFGDTYARNLCSRVREHDREAVPNDFIATAVEFTACSITDQLRWLPGTPKDIVISGGGARNKTLVDRIAALNPAIDVRLFDALYFDGDAKEAVAFAYLGWLNMQGLPGNLPNVTGSSGLRILGRVTPA